MPIYLFMQIQFHQEKMVQGTNYYSLEGQSNCTQFNKIMTITSTQ